MASPPLLFSATVTLLDLLPAAPCSPLGHPSHPLDHPGRHTSLQLEGFKLQTSRKWISEQGLFFFLGGEADKAARLGSCCLGLLKTLGMGGERPTQEVVGAGSSLGPLAWAPPPTEGSVGAPRFPSEECAPFPDTPDRFSCTDASPAPGTAPHNEAAPVRNVCKSWGSSQGSQIAGSSSKSQDKSRSHPVDNSFAFLPQIHPQQNC